MKQIAIHTLIATLAGSPAFADQSAPVSPTAIVKATNGQDPRIRYFRYGENNVYRLDLYLKSVTAIQFSDTEEVESILIGDSASWEVVKLKNGHVVSIKPTISFADTNMTVYTDRRVYTFELRSLGEFASDSTSTPMFRSVFTYPNEKKSKTVTAAATPVRVDSNYLVSGQAVFRPSWVQDDGRQTSFFLAENAPRPAIFKVGPNNEEQLINSRTVAGKVVVDGVSNYWVLRIGDEAVCIGKGGAVRGNPHLLTKSEPGDSHAG